MIYRNKNKIIYTINSDFIDRFNNVFKYYEQFYLGTYITQLSKIKYNIFSKNHKKLFMREIKSLYF